MKTLIRTIMILVVVNLITTGPLFAGNVSGEESPVLPEIKVKQADLEQAKIAEIAQKQAMQVNQLTLPSLSVGRNIMYGSRFGSASEVLVIPSAEISTEDIAAITEDMNIMSRIFEKNLQQAQIKVNSMFSTGSDPFHIALMHGKSSTQGMYLQGYGALFLMKVDFPLSPGPQLDQEQEKETQEEEDVDPIWTQFQRQMYEPQDSSKEKSKSPEKKYDPEKVENLKTTFIKSLKHAANIRNLKPDESVILTITGSHLSSGYKSVRTIPGRNDVIVIDKNNKTQIITGDRIDDIGLSLPTVLVIRAKKSDIDRFAKGDLDFDQFKQNTQILTSAYLADPSDSGNPFTGYYFDY